MLGPAGSEAPVTISAGTRTVTDGQCWACCSLIRANDFVPRICPGRCQTTAVIDQSIWAPFNADMHRRRTAHTPLAAEGAAGAPPRPSRL